MNKNKAKIGDILRSSWLCIRFPFLYPRNRFSDDHYTNWKLDEKRRSIYKKWAEWSNSHQDLYYYILGDDSLLNFEESGDIFIPDDFSRSLVKSEYVMKLANDKDKFYYWLYGVLDGFLSIFHIIPTYSEFDSIPYGWRKRFGIQFCKELKTAILKDGGRKLMKEFRIMDIKEKWGKFTIYVNTYSESVERVICKYEYISKFVCIDCGEDAVKKTTGWMCPYCEKCIPKDRDWIWIDPVYGWSNPIKSKDNEEKMKE